MTGRGLSKTTTETEIDWPTEWRLPAAGEAIWVSPGVGGHVEFVAWDIERKALRAMCR